MRTISPTAGTNNTGDQLNNTRTIKQHGRLQLNNTGENSSTWRVLKNKTRGTNSTTQLPFDDTFCQLELLSGPAAPQDPIVINVELDLGTAASPVKT